MLAKTLATVLDSAFTIPGTNQRIGLDPLLGLIPVLGDIIALGISLYIVVVAKQLGMSRFQLTRMGLNLVLDTVVGAVPVVGDALDLVWKANMKNIAMIEKHLKKQGFTLEETVYQDQSQQNLSASEQTIDVVAKSHPIGTS